MSSPTPTSSLAWIRDAIANGFDGPTFVNGGRIVVLAAVPFSLGILAHSPQAGLFGALGAVFVGFCDPPGSYRRRGIALIAVTIFLATLATLGTLLQLLQLWSLPVLLALGIILAFIGTLTANAGKATTFALVMVILGIGIPGGWGDSAERGIAILAGGAWMILGTLFAWPFAPYSQARKALQKGLADVASVLETALAGLSVPRPDGIVQANASWLARSTAYQSLDAALEILTDLRSARDGTSMTGRRLVLALQQARLVTLSVGSLGEVMEQIPDRFRAALDPIVANVLRGLARDVTALGRAIGPNAQNLSPPSLSVGQVDIAALLSPVRAKLPEAGADAGATADLDSLEFSLVNLLAAVARVRDSLSGGIEAPPSMPDAQDLKPVSPLQAMLGADPLHVVVDNLAPGSPRLRHALRVGVVLALTSFAQDFLTIPHGYWVSLAAIAVLKPGYGGTRAASIARIVGTVLGGLLAAILLHFFHGTLAHAVFAIGFAVCAFGTLSRNQTLGTLLLTPFVVMLFALMSPGGADTIWLTRIGDTVIGAVIAFLALLTLWPDTERDRVPPLAAAALAELGKLLRLLVARATAEAVSSGAVRARRRALSLSMSDLDASWERLLGEPRHWHPARDRYYILVSLCRLASVQVAPLLTCPVAEPAPDIRARVEAVRDALLELLDQMSATLRGNGPPLEIATHERTLRPLLRDLDRLALGAGTEAPAGAGLHMLIGTLDRLSETAMNAGHVTLRLADPVADRPGPAPRYSLPAGHAGTA